MVELLGHLALALLSSLVAWFLWDGRVSAAFAGLTLVTAMLPDVDLALRHVLPMDHHGVTHTVPFVLAVAVVAGAVVEYGLRAHFERLLARWAGYRVSRGALFVFVTGAFALGGLSHLFGDMLSSPDVAKPVSPLWPLIDSPIAFDVIWYASPWWNTGLFLVALACHAVLAYVDLRIDHPYQIVEDA